MITLILSIALQTLSWAEGFSTSYTQLQLPPQWKCKLSDQIWICRSPNPIEAKEAYIAIKAKLRGPNDSLSSYKQVLERPVTKTNSRRKVSLSKVYGASVIKIDGNPWVQAVHLGSEIDNYFTKYLLTLKGDLGVAIEFTYHKQKYNKYQPIIQQLENSLRLLPTPATNAKLVLLPKSTEKFPVSNLDSPPNLEESPTALNKQLYVILGLGFLILFALFIYWRVN